MLAQNIVPDAVELLMYAQADGQYAATTLLFNMAAYNQEARAAVSACEATEPLVRLLCHDSWCALLSLMAMVQFHSKEPCDLSSRHVARAKGMHATLNQSRPEVRVTSLCTSCDACVQCVWPQLAQRMS